MRLGISCLSLALTFATAFSVCSYAQDAISTGSITGTAHDPSGKAVADAEVTAVNEATGERVTSSTNGSGTFYLPPMKIGQYYISFSVADFKTVEVEGVDVGVGHNSGAKVCSWQRQPAV